MKNTLKTVAKILGAGFICGVGSWIGVELCTTISDKIDEAKWKKQQKILSKNLEKTYLSDND